MQGHSLAEFGGIEVNPRHERLIQAVELDGEAANAE